MAVVYRAVHRDSGAIVVVKTVAADSARQVHHIRREIAALSRLRHPAIVRVLDSGVHEGRPWYAMQHLRGRLLSAICSDIERRVASGEHVAPVQDESGATSTMPFFAMPVAPVVTSSGDLTRTVVDLDVRASPVERERENSYQPPARHLAAGGDLPLVLALLRRLCAPLSYLHGEGLVHRDLKPSNIMVSDYGIPVLMDFGLLSQFSARRGREEFEVGGAIAGTAPYMAPEQVTGEYVDARTDLYALGCIAFELVTGRRPFLGDSREVLQMHLHAQPLRPSMLVSGVPPRLDELILGLLEKRPNHRIGYADCVAAELAAMGADDGVWSSSPRPRAYLYRAEFAGRGIELRALDQRLSALREGRGGMVLIRGESGAGKTRLLMQVARRAVQSGMRVLAGSATDGSTVPLEAFLGPLLEISDVCRSSGFETSEAVFGARGPVLAGYEPGIRSLPGQMEREPAGELDPRKSVVRLGRYLHDTMAAFAGDVPLVLVLDDIQWLDELAADVLAGWASRAASDRLGFLVLACARTDHAGPHDRLAELDGVEPLQLDRLDTRAIAAIIGDMMAVRPPMVFSAFLAEHSEGNPFFVAEYLRCAVSEGIIWRDARGAWQLGQPDGTVAVMADYERIPLPLSLRELILRRLGELPVEARRVVQLAALSGRKVQFLALWQMSGLADEELLDIIALLIHRQILEELGHGALQFVHDQLREVAEESIPSEDLPRLHRAAAEALTEIGTTLGTVDHGQLGTHWQIAGEADRAREHFLEGGKQAIERVDLPLAQRLLSRYLSIGDPDTPSEIGVRNLLGKSVLERLGRFAEALQQHRLAFATADRIGARALAAESLRRMGVINLRLAEYDQAESCLTEAIERARTLGERDIEASALLRLGDTHHNRGNMTLSRSLYQTALEHYRELGDRSGEGNTLRSLANLHFEFGELDLAEQRFGEAVGIARAIGDRAAEGRGTGNLGVLEYYRGNYDAARRHYATCLALLTQLGDRSGEGVSMGNLGLVCYMLGDYDRARRHYRAALEIHREVEDQYLVGFMLSNQATLDMDMGRLEEARAGYEQALAIHIKLGTRIFEARTRWELALFQCRVGDELAEATAAAEQAVEMLRVIKRRDYLGTALAILAQLRFAANRPYAELLAESRDIAARQRVGEDSEMGRALRRVERATVEAGRPELLWRGELRADLPERLRQRLRL